MTAGGVRELRRVLLGGVAGVACALAGRVVAVPRVITRSRPSDGGVYELIVRALGGVTGLTAGRVRSRGRLVGV